VAFAPIFASAGLTQAWPPKPWKQVHLGGIPGDILQFRDHLVLTTTITDVTFEDGTGYENTERLPMQRAPHTAVVAENKGAFGLKVLEQNIDPGGMKVQLHDLPLASRQPVVKTETRMMKHSSGKLRRAKVVTTTTVQVSGTISAYRPRAKK
jgi:hypothetical protein